MATSNANPYLREAVMTATPEQLQLMLYDGAIRFALQGRDALEREEYETAYECLTRAQHAILEMHNGLRPEVNPELCERTGAIYSFLYKKLVDANVERDLGAIDDAVKVLRIERDTWQILVNKVSEAREHVVAEAEKPSTVAGSAGNAVSDPTRQSTDTADAAKRPTLSVEG